jgi:hypothetical protein
MKRSYPEGNRISSSCQAREAKLSEGNRIQLLQQQIEAWQALLEKFGGSK